MDHLDSFFNSKKTLRISPNAKGARRTNQLCANRAERLFVQLIHSELDPKGQAKTAQGGLIIELPYSGLEPEGIVKIARGSKYCRPAILFVINYLNFTKVQKHT